MEPGKPERASDQQRAKSIHSGHRKRVRQRFLEHGGEALDDYQLVELILFYSRPQGDVNPLAHQLVARFGSLKGILDASTQARGQVIGVSDNTAALFKLFYEVMLRYQRSAQTPGTIINSSEDAGEYLRPCFVGAQTELAYLLSVDAKGKLLGCDLVNRGAADAVLLDQRRVVELAIRRRASQVFLAHCHTSGLAVPSQEDIWATQRIAHTLAQLHIRLTDHLIFADNDYVSLAQSGILEIRPM